MRSARFEIAVVGGGHAGLEAAWAAANLLARDRSVALVTLDPAKTGEMSCNPAIGGLAKGQIVREIDALGGLMGLAADASGIQFKVLNTSKGPAVHGPRCQSDKHAYAEAVRALIASRPEIAVIAGSVEGVRTEPVDGGKVATGLDVATPDGDLRVEAGAVVLTTGTFMRGLMHTGDRKTPGGRHGEGAASAISSWLAAHGFELGRLKTGTPPRLRKPTIDWGSLPLAPGDDRPVPFSDLTGSAGLAGVPGRFPAIDQVDCRQTKTSPEAHELIRRNLHRAPMYSGEIDANGPRYCPSLEDKVVRFPDRESHGVFLEPEGLRTDWVYCNGISSSLPADVQNVIVRTMPGCERAEILRYGYAVEYDTVRPHQINATGETRSVARLFLAGQINGTSGYEEAAAQGVVAGVNAVRSVRGQPSWELGRDEAYIGVLMDDLVSKTPVEPYRMFTSRAEHRLLLRADNAADRLTPVAEALGLLATTDLGRARSERFARRRREIAAIDQAIDGARLAQQPLDTAIRRSDFTPADLRAALPEIDASDASVFTVMTDRRYEAYVARQRAEIRRHAAMERRRVPAWIDYGLVEGLRAEARAALAKFRPETFGRAGRLEGVTPADVSILLVHARRGPAGRPAGAAAG